MPFILLLIIFFQRLLNILFYYQPCCTLLSGYQILLIHHSLKDNCSSSRFFEYSIRMTLNTNIFYYIILFDMITNKCLLEALLSCDTVFLNRLLVLSYGKYLSIF